MSHSLTTSLGRLLSRSCLLAGIALTAQPVPTESGLDARTLREIPERLQRFVEDGTIAGAVTLVARHDRVLSLGAVGQADLAAGRRMEPDHLFWIASMTKPITATAI